MKKTSFIQNFKIINNILKVFKRKILNEKDDEEKLLLDTHSCFFSN